MTKSGIKDNLTYKIYSTRQEMGLAAAAEASAVVKKLLAEQEQVNIMFAAAPSQNEFLSAIAGDKTIDFTRINAFHMDEYIGLDKDAPQGFGNFLVNAIFSKAPFKSVNLMDSSATDAEKECDRYAALLNKNKIDVVFMGIGENGHIAFNDPHVADFKDSKTVKVVSLDEKCRTQQVNDGCFADISLVPKFAMTVTIPALTAPKYVFCMVPAITKAAAVAQTLKGEINESCPATILRKHSNAILYLDKDSSSAL